MDKACTTHEVKMNAYRIFVGKSEGRRQLGRSRCTGGRIVLRWILER
jgi:hypothetical protein